MAYYVYLNGVVLPITPSKITTTVNNRNETIDLVNGNEVNILKKAGLTDISFEILIPSSEYPFAVYDNGFQDASYYLSLLSALKVDEQPFQFVVTRTKPDGTLLWDTNMTVSLESFTQDETSEEGMDVIIKIELKQYRHYGTKKITISADGKTITVVGNQRLQTKGVPKTYTVKEGDTLWRICRTILGDETKLDAVASLNGILEPNTLTAGTVIRLDVESTTNGE